jgi:hypothetical protein
MVDRGIASASLSASGHWSANGAARKPSDAATTKDVRSQDNTHSRLARWTQRRFAGRVY